MEREGNEGKLKVENEDWVCYSDRYREWSSDEVIDNDNKAFKDTTFNKNQEINKSHKILLENSDYLYNRVMDELNSIHNMLILNDFCNLFFGIGQNSGLILNFPASHHEAPVGDE